jgi:predicted TIM-barrel fold metal-dependent hydrolase
MSQPAKRTDFGRTQPPNDGWLAHAIAESPLEPELPIIDTHMHLWHHATGYRYFVEEYARDAAGCGHRVEASIYIECRSMYRAHGPEHLQSVGETEFAAGMAAIAASEKYTTTRVAAGIVANADPGRGAELDEALDAHVLAANGRLRGIRRGAKWDADSAVKGAVGADRAGLYLEPAFQRGVRRIAARRLLFETSIFHPQIPDVTQLARAAPEASIVLIHAGSPVGHGCYAGRGDEVHAHWLGSMTELAACPNVTVKLGGILMSLANFDFGTAPRPPTSEELAQLWRPYTEPLLELFGAGRCMVASNFPVDKAGFGYGTVWNMFKRITSGCSQDDKRAIFSGTARRIYGV